MYYVEGESGVNPKCNTPSSDESMLWKSKKPPPNHTRYNLTSFAITLNELTLELKVHVMYQLCISFHLSSLILSDPWRFIMD